MVSGKNLVIWKAVLLEFLQKFATKMYVLIQYQLFVKTT